MTLIEETESNQETRKGWNVKIYPCESFHAGFHAENSCPDDEIKTYREYFYQTFSYDDTDSCRQWNEFRTYFDRQINFSFS